MSEGLPGVWLSSDGRIHVGIQRHRQVHEVPEILCGSLRSVMPVEGNDCAARYQRDL